MKGQNMTLKSEFLCPIELALATNLLFSLCYTNTVCLVVFLIVLEHLEQLGYETLS